MMFVPPIENRLYLLAKQAFCHENCDSMYLLYSVVVVFPMNIKLFLNLNEGKRFRFMQAKRDLFPIKERAAHTRKDNIFLIAFVPQIENEPSHPPSLFPMHSPQFTEEATQKSIYKQPFKYSYPLCRGTFFFSKRESIH